MKKYIDADKLKAEIEQLLGVPERVEDWRYRIKMEENNALLKRIINLIDTLQQKQPEVDLEKEIDACWQNWVSPSNQKEVEGVFPKTEFAMYARHFYELGLNARN